MVRNDDIGDAVAVEVGSLQLYDELGKICGEVRSCLRKRAAAVVEEDAESIGDRVGYEYVWLLVVIDVGDGGVGRSEG